RKSSVVLESKASGIPKRRSAAASMAGCRSDSNSAPAARRGGERLRPERTGPMKANSASMPALVHYELKPHHCELREVPVPKIGPDDVLLRTVAVGICGSDVHQYHNSHSWKVNVPVVLGHEFGGIVEEVGENVKGFAPGDRVVSETAAV